MAEFAGGCGETKHMKSILIIISFIILVITIPFGFVFEMICAGFYWGQCKAREIAIECKSK